MATKEIELMPAEVRAERRKRETKRLVILASIAILVVSASLAAAVLAFYTVLLADINLTKKSIADENRKIATFEETANLTKRVRVKGTAISNIIKTRNYYSILFKTLSDISPQDVTVSNLSVAKDQIVVSGTAKSYVAVAKFLLVVIAPEKGGVIFSRAALTSVSLDSKSGEARFAANLTLQKGALQK